MISSTSSSPSHLSGKRFRWLRRVSAFAFAAALFAGAGYLASKPNWQLDWSSAGHNSLHPISAELLDGLAGPVTVRMVARTGSPLAQHAQTLVARHQSSKADLSLEFIDPRTHPEEARELGLTAVGQARVFAGANSVRIKHLTDQGLANAFIQLSRTSKRKIRALVGHGERRIDGRRNDDLGLLGQSLLERGFDIGDLDLSVAGEVSPDTSVLIVSAGATSLLPKEQTMVRDFIDAGGNLLVLGEPAARTEHIVFITQALGLEIGDVQVVAATAAERRDKKIPADFLIVNQYPPHPVTDGFDVVTLFPQIGPVHPLAGSSWEALSLIAADYDASRLVAKDESNGTPVGAALQRGAQRAIVVGDGDFAANQYIGNGGNLELAVRMLEWLAEEDTLHIPPRLVPDPRLDVSQSTLQFVSLISIVLIPLALVTIGVLRWSWRRRR
ncbi:MAG: Gldg family protein [Gammaproteobacteria bacterium]|nr:Gldg family protein [Gammaproteobacteria bacterium]